MESRPKTWLDLYFDLFPLHYALTSVLSAALVFLIGLVTSRQIDFHSVYLGSVPVYLGTFGIAWVAYWGGWASRTTHSMLAEIVPAFLSQRSLHIEKSRYFPKLYSIKAHIGGSIVFIIVTWALTALGARIHSHFGWTLPLWLDRFSIWLEAKGKMWFEPSWSEPPFLVIKMAIIDFYAIPIVLLLFSTGWGIVLYARFVYAISKLPIIPFLDGAKAKLRRIAQIGIRTGLAWAVGVSLFVILFRPSFGALSVSLTTLFTFLGLTILFWPQFVIHRALQRKKEELINLLLEDVEIPGQTLLYDHSGASIKTEVGMSTAILAEQVLEPKTLRVDRLIRSVASTNTWLYKPVDALSLAGTWLIPIVTLLATKFL